MALAESTAANVRPALDGLRQAEPTTSDAGRVIAFGPWRCDLVAYTFVLSVAGLHGLLERTSTRAPTAGHGWRR